MGIERIEIGKSSNIVVTDCVGDLVIRQWSEFAVQAKGTYEYVEGDSLLTFNSNGDLHLIVPTNVAIDVKKVQGDLLIKGVHGDIRLGDVIGDATLQNLSKVFISKLHQDLSAKYIEGPLVIENVVGDALARNINGDVKIDRVYGDLGAYFINGSVSIGQINGDINLRTVNGSVSIDAGQRDANFRNLGSLCSVNGIHGDIRLKGGLSEGKHTFEALGDIVLRWPINASIHLAAEAHEVRNRLPLEDIKELDNGLFGRIGDGGCFVTLKSGGRISLKEGKIIEEKWNDNQKEAIDMDFMIDFTGLGERISAEVSQSMASLTNELENSFGPEFAQNISAKVTQQAELAARKAEAAAEKARRYAEREAARAGKYQRRTAYSNPPKRSPKMEESPRKISSEEQLKILRMVENGTISPDEAATLLEALEL